MASITCGDLNSVPCSVRTPTILLFSVNTFAQQDYEAQQRKLEERKAEILKEIKWLSDKKIPNQKNNNLWLS